MTLSGDASLSESANTKKPATASATTAAMPMAIKPRGRRRFLSFPPLMRTPMVAGYAASVAQSP